MSQQQFYSILPALMALAAVQSAQAALITVPTGLSSGDPYRLAFVTSTVHTATSSSISDYNAIVDLLGDTAIPSEWKAIASTSAIDARSNTATDPSPAGSTGVPIFLLDGTKLVDDYDDLWDGSIGALFRIDESGSPIPDSNPSVWTGTLSSGLTAVSAPMGGAIFSDVMVGLTNSTTSTWVAFTSFSGTSERHLYGISGTLSAPDSTAVPEPGMLSLSIGLLLLAEASWFSKYRMRARARSREASSRRRTQ